MNASPSSVRTAAASRPWSATWTGCSGRTEGRVLHDGVDIAEVRVAALAARVGIVFQNPDRQIFAGKVRAEVEFGPKILGLSSADAAGAATAALEAVGLADLADANPYDLGYSRRKLLTLASVLAMATPVVVLDEPTTGQDARGVARIRQVIADLDAAGRTVILISHDMRFVAETVGRIVVMRDGRVVGDGSPAEVFAETSWPTLRSTYLEPPFAARVGARLGLGSTPTEIGPRGRHGRDTVVLTIFGPLDSCQARPESAWLLARRRSVMRILLAVDGSASADRALDLVAALPWHDGGRVRIVSVAPSRAEILGLPWSLAATTDAIDTEEATLRVHQNALDAAEEELRSVRGDLVLEPVLLRGRTASLIVDEARTMPADLIVIGHRGHSRWESALLGSVSAEVVDHAPCAVLVARDDRMGPVVLADDGSPNARVAEAIMTECPLFAGLPITVVSVVTDAISNQVASASLIDPAMMDAYSLDPTAEQRMVSGECAAAAQRLRDAGLDAEPEVRAGDPAHEIIAVARARQAGVIIVGTRGQTGLRRLLLGSVARNVLLHAPCSVMVVRGGVHVAPLADEGHEDRELVSPVG